MTRIALLVAGLSAFALAACGNGPEETQEAEPDEKSSAAGTDANAPELGRWGVDLTAMKPGVDPGDDFFRHANGAWLDNFEIPADKTSYGSFLVLRDRSEERVRKIIEDLAGESPPAGSVTTFSATPTAPGSTISKFRPTRRATALSWCCATARKSACARSSRTLRAKARRPAVSRR